MIKKPFKPSVAHQKGHNAVHSRESQPFFNTSSSIFNQVPVQRKQTSFFDEAPTNPFFKSIQSEQLLSPVQKQRIAEKDEMQKNELPIQEKENKTALPSNLKRGIENLSGYSMDDVKVHRNSHKPAQLQAHAYAQGTAIHLGAGQEKHLPHEAWHVVQQKQGRVKPTLQLKGKVQVNDDIGLEKEADAMGQKALVRQPLPIGKYQPVKHKGNGIKSPLKETGAPQPNTIAQRKKTAPHEGFARDGGHALIPQHPGLPLLEKGAPAKVNDRRIFEIVEMAYNESLQKGRHNWANLHVSLMRYQNDRQGLVNELTQKRAEYQRRWQEEYQTSFGKTNEGGRLVSTYGRVDEAQAAHGRSKGKGYNNTMFPELNTISAEGNYANDDPARDANRGINNSEILWQQYLMTVRAQNSIFENQEERTTAKMKELSKVIRKNLQNGRVQKVVYFCYPDGQKWNSEMHWTPNNEEFFALLGTPNVAAEVFLLIDHVDELGGKTIRRIETTADQTINIIFGQAPGIQQIKHTLINFSPKLWNQYALPATDLGRENPLMLR